MELMGHKEDSRTSKATTDSVSVNENNVAYCFIANAEVARLLRPKIVST